MKKNPIVLYASGIILFLIVVTPALTASAPIVVDFYYQRNIVKIGLGAFSKKSKGKNKAIIASNNNLKYLDEIVQSVREIIAAGIVGINIEDSIDLNPKLIDEMEFCERISAIRALSDSLGFHLVINARTDSFYTSSGLPREKLSESIKRGNRYQEAGADLSDP
jgi:hypothetical protein